MRPNNAIAGEQGGISRSVSQQSGGFISCAYHHETCTARIQVVGFDDKPAHIRCEMAEGSFLALARLLQDAGRGNERLGGIGERIRQVGKKRLPAKLLDQNRLHVYLSERNNAQRNVGKEERRYSMSRQDVRWVQRFQHFLKALSQLREAVALAQQRPLSKLEEQGLIRAFEFTHELAWKTLKDFLEHRSVQHLYGSKDVTRAAFKTGLLENGEAWMNMIQSRNLTSHTYDEATAAQTASAIHSSYVAEFDRLRITLEELNQEEEE